MVVLEPDNASADRKPGCLLPLLWMFAGHVAWLVILFAIIHRGDGPASLLSMVFWGVVGLIILVRYLDVTRFDGKTSDAGTPATIKDVRRFSSWLVASAGSAWLTAHLL